MTGFR